MFLAMSEGINKRTCTEGGEEADKRHQKESVLWKVEEPSEFRKKSELENIGKDVQNFRLFYDVSSQLAPRLVIACTQSSRLNLVYACTLVVS